MGALLFFALACAGVAWVWRRMGRIREAEASERDAKRAARVLQNVMGDFLPGTGGQRLDFGPPPTDHWEDESPNTLRVEPPRSDEPDP